MGSKESERGGGLLLRPILTRLRGGGGAGEVQRGARALSENATHS